MRFVLSVLVLFSLSNCAFDVPESSDSALAVNNSGLVFECKQREESIRIFRQANDSYYANVKQVYAAAETPAGYVTETQRYTCKYNGDGYKYACVSKDGNYRVEIMKKMGRAEKYQAMFSWAGELARDGGGTRPGEAGVWYCEL